VRVLGAALRFPLGPGAAARALEGRRAALLAPLLPAAACALYLRARGCAGGDAWAGGGALLLLATGAGAGAAAACALARRLLGRPGAFRALWPPCAVFAAWAALLYPAAVAAVALLGGGSTSPLTAALVLLAWGVASGTGLLEGEEGEVEQGRLLVGSCLGAGGALLGLVLAALLARAALVAAGPAAPGHEGAGVRPGDPVLARPGAPPFFRFGGRWGGEPVRESRDSAQRPVAPPPPVPYNRGRRTGPGAGRAE